MKYDDEDENDAASENLLSIMDGVYNSERSHIFLLTTNKLKVNDNLISRPSRIRYLKSFDDVLDDKALNEFIDDNLIYTEYKQEIIEYVDTLIIATIDIINGGVLKHYFIEDIDTQPSLFSSKADYAYGYNDYW